MKEQERQQKIRSQLLNLCIILLGNTIYALAVVMFIIPNDLITGGTTGLGLFFEHQFQIPLSAFVSIFNVSMFVLGAYVLGKKFALTTLVSSFYYPIILSVLKQIPGIQMYTDNLLLAVIYSGLMIGVGIGIVIRAGASTGGMDIPPLVLYKKFKIPVSVTLYILDCGVLLLQFLFANKEQVLIGILLVLLYTVVLDKVINVGKKQIQVKVISKESEKIREIIIQDMDRGATLLNGETGLYGDDCKVVMTVISNKELSKLNQEVLEIDPSAFMVVNQVTEVSGRGFTLEKIHKNVDCA